jgi:hypothetical protein
MAEENSQPGEVSASISAMLGEGPIDEGTKNEEGEEGVLLEGEQKSEVGGEPDAEKSETGETQEPEGGEVTTDSRIEKLEGMVETLLGRLSAKKEEEEEAEPNITFDLDNLVDEATYARAMESREAFNKVLKSVAVTAANQAVKHIYKTLPQIVDNNVTRKVVLNGAIRQFYTSNRDLTPHCKFVAFTFDELMAKNPGKGPIEIIETLLAREVKSRLGLKGTGKAPGKPVTKANVAPGSTGREVQKKSISTVASEIDKMARL